MDARVVWVVPVVFRVGLEFVVAAVLFVVVLDRWTVIFPPSFRRREPNIGEIGVVVGRFSTLGTPIPPKPTPRFVLRLL